MRDNRFDIFGSHGRLKVSPVDGAVVGRDPRGSEDDEDSGYPKIVRIDLAEYRQHYDLPADAEIESIDILDVGFWVKDGTYVPPDHEYRQWCRDNEAMTRALYGPTGRGFLVIV